MAITFDEREFDQIVIDMIDKVRQKGIGITNFSTGSVIRCLIDIMADEVYNLNGYVKDTYDGFSLDNRTGEDLDLIGEAMGIYRRESKKPMGVVTFYTGDAPATSTITIPQGYVVATSVISDDDEQIEFEVVSNTTIAVGQSSANVVVIGVEAGSVNIPIGNLNVMTEDLQGVNYVMNTNVIISGTGVQDDDSYREMIRKGNKTFGTSKAIRDAVMNVDGVKNCWINDGTGDTFHIVVAYDTTDDTINRTVVSPAILDAVYEVKPVGIVPNITEASFENLSVTISSNNELSTVQQNGVKTVLQQYIDGLVPSEVFRNARAEMVINRYLTSENPNLYAVVKVSGTRSDVTPTSGKLLNLSTVTFNTTI